jgi:hypothetical protein
MTTIGVVRGEAVRIGNACTVITSILATTELSADEWRMALGVIHEASQTVYDLRRSMLDEAIRRNRDTT